jgi:hypothetical protein
MGTRIEAAAIAEELGGFANRAQQSDRRCSTRLEGAGVGVDSAAAAGLVALLSGKAVERSP